ncbi:glycosyltransferase 87 family protein [Streptomyces sp. H27-D2]|uniref:glycosyltransferase 87 family protein n=1 Tax=Streptomyces sp. H27-D2 TaxID=3046304 RepID=UPI002DBED24C|nr:glycosyltransferase 87 family protein [Streptomyces sp. H27-D2]MEC4019313.1 glycosyltransferase 87 family protein [Streptomyces sp. H27-D2]
MGGKRLAVVITAWSVTRALLLLCVLKVLTLPGPDVTSDVAVIYRGWFDVLGTGSFPLDDVTWQYPPAAALAVLSPGLLPFLDYATAFFVLILLLDAVVLALLLFTARRPERSSRGVRVWVAGVPLLGPTAYARYDLMVTAVAVAALLAAARHPRAAGALAAFGALVKVWPVLLLIGIPRGRPTRATWTAAVLTALALVLGFAATMPGAFAFLAFQRDRGTEVESLGSLVFHVARHFGWNGEVLLNYGSVEYLGPYVDVVSAAALALTVLAFGWLLLWRLRVREFTPGTPFDAAFAAVLLFTTTSRVISPQYLIWLVGLAAVCMTVRSSRQGLPVVLVLAATFTTMLEFPIWFAQVVAGDPLGIALLVVRNGLLVAATLISCRRLWTDTVTGPRRRAAAAAAARKPRSGGGRRPAAEQDADLLTW